MYVVRKNFDRQTIGDAKVYITKKAFRRNMKTYVEMKEELAIRLLRSGYLKVGCVSCRVQKKTKVIRCYRCQGFGHLAATCTGPDWIRACWKCGKKGHKAAVRDSAPQCYLCTRKKEEPWTDNLPESMRCSSFKVAAPSRKPLNV